MDKIRSLGTQRSIFVVCFLTAAWELIHVVTAPLSVMIQYVPDDSFYYLEIALNLARTGRSSFDGGLTTTTGYHVLWAWIDEAIAWAVHFDPMSMLRGMVAVSGIVALATVFAVAAFAWRRSTALLTAITLAMTSLSFLCNSVSAMEWSVTVAISAATAYFLIHTSTTAQRPVILAGLYLLGGFGSLARSDFGGQALCYAGAAIAVWLLCKETRYVLPSSCVLLGAVSGLGFAFFRNYSISGSFVQGSAQMKELWGRAGGHSAIPFLPVLLRSVLYVPVHSPTLIPGIIASMNSRGSGSTSFWGPVISIGTLAALFTCIFGSIAFLLERSGKEVSASGDRFLLFSAGSMLMLYAFLYTLNSFSMQIWYSADVSVAIVVLLYFLAKRSESDRRVAWLAPLLAAVSILNLLIFAITKPKFVQQQPIPQVALAIKHSIGDQRIGISDAGIFNFVWGGNVINLDGLVNDEIIRYVPDRLPCYLLDKKIKYFAGFGVPAELTFGLEPYTNYSTKKEIVTTSTGQPIFIFEVDDAKLRVMPTCQR